MEKEEVKIEEVKTKSKINIKNVFKNVFTKMNIIVIISVVILTILDVISKILTDGKTIKVLGNFLIFESCHNYGAAWSFLATQSWAVIFFIIISFINIALITWFYIFNNQKNILFYISMIFIYAGAFGNLFDRMFLGYVRDFIKFSFFPAIFNIADSCLCVGIALFCIYFIFNYKFKGERELENKGGKLETENADNKEVK